MTKAMTAIAVMSPTSNMISEAFENSMYLGKKVKKKLYEKGKETRALR